MLTLQPGVHDRELVPAPDSTVTPGDSRPIALRCWQVRQAELSVERVAERRPDVRARVRPLGDERLERRRQHADDLGIWRR